MEFEEYDFTRNPVVLNQALLLESRGAACGLSILAPSIEKLGELGRTAPNPMRMSQAVAACSGLSIEPARLRRYSMARTLYRCVSRDH
jgi:hypothetical protein